MWATSFFLGNFVGPTGAGILVDYIQFKKTTIIFLSLYCFIIFVDIIELFVSMKCIKNKAQEQKNNVHQNMNEEDQPDEEVIDDNEQLEYKQLKLYISDHGEE